MKTKILTAALVLGLSSVAFADHEKPLRNADDRAYKAPLWKDGERDRGRPDVRRPLPMPVEWTTLSTAKKIQNKQTIAVNGRQAFSKLKLEASMGKTFIDKVVIVFGNGTRQVVDLDKSLAMREAPLLIDLEGKNRRVSKVVVYGKSGRRAAINLLAA